MGSYMYGRSRRERDGAGCRGGNPGVDRGRLGRGIGRHNGRARKGELSVPSAGRNRRKTFVSGWGCTRCAPGAPRAPSSTGHRERDRLIRIALPAPDAGAQNRYCAVAVPFYALCFLPACFRRPRYRHGVTVHSPRTRGVGRIWVRFRADPFTRNVRRGAANRTAWNAARPAGVHLSSTGGGPAHSPPMGRPTIVPVACGLSL